MFELDNIDVEKELALMTENERNTMISFLMKLGEAFQVNGLSELKDSKSAACQEVYKVYDMMKGNLMF